MAPGQTPVYTQCMRSRLSLNTWIACAALVAAVVLTVARPSPEGIISFGERVVRAAPGAPASSVARHNLAALKIFNLTLIRVRDAYVDPQRIDPREMLYSALDSVQFDIPEVLVEPDRDRDRVEVVVNDKRQSFSTADVDSPWRLGGKLKKIFRFIEANMNPGADLAQVEYSAVNGMLETLDPHSILLDPESASEMDVNTSGKFGGLGIVIRMYKEKLTIVKPIKGTPAWNAGIKKGDQIAKINQEVTENLTLNEAVSRMRGDPGTPVTLWIARKGEPGLIRFDLTRASIKVESVDPDEVKLLDKKVGYIKIKQFSGQTSREVKQAMDKLRAQGAKGWIIDLRWNPGGLLEQAIKVADLFVDKGTIVTTVGNHEREPRRATRKNSDTDSPMVVLVNSASASASEIVAGALKNLDRALIVGTPTFGKGSVQILYDNDDGSKLKLTIAQYLTPGDRSIQSVGITPDVDLQRMFVPKKNDSYKDFLRLMPPSHSYRESDLRAHLTSRFANKPEKPTFHLGFLYEKPKTSQASMDDPLGALDDEDSVQPNVDEEEEPLDEGFVEDFEIDLAKRIVASAGSSNHKAMMTVARRVVTRVRAAQQQKLIQALAALGVDWTAPPADAHTDAVLSGHVALASLGPVHAGDTVKLVGMVTNHGSGPAYRVHARVSSEDRVFDDTEMVFGRVDPGQNRSWTSYVKVPEDALDRVDLLRVDFTEATGAKVNAAPVRMRIVAADRPVFAYAHQLLDEGNGDGLVQRGERHRLRVTIKNNGRGDSDETVALLKNLSGEGVLVTTGRVKLDKLPAGAEKTVDFEFAVKDLEAKELTVELTVYDAVSHEVVNDKLKYPIASSSAGPARARGQVQVVASRATLFEGASSASNAIATAKKGTVFRLSGKEGGWFKVDLGKARSGFIAASEVKNTRKQAGEPTVATIWQVTPPVLKLEIPSYQVTGDTYDLRGRANDETHVEDVYVFVSNRDAKIDNKKVFYKSNRNGKRSDQLDFSTEIPLWPGSNRITVVARENATVKSAHTMYLYRTEGNTGEAMTSR